MNVNKKIVKVTGTVMVLTGTLMKVSVSNDETVEICSKILTKIVKKKLVE